MTELALRLFGPPHGMEPTGATTLHELVAQSGVPSTRIFTTIIRRDSTL